jgi:hypothetical protein
MSCIHRCQLLIGRVVQAVHCGSGEPPRSGAEDQQDAD